MMLRPKLFAFLALLVGLLGSAPALAAADAAFVSQSVPSAMTAGHSATVTVVMQNTGTTTWSAATCGLVAASQAIASNWGVATVPLASAVAPGNTATFSFSITAPSSAGSYPFRWTMACTGTGGGIFGDLSPLTSIAVTGSGGGSSSYDAQYIAQTVPASMVAGQAYSVTVQMKNTGSTAWRLINDCELGPQNPQGNTTWSLGGKGVGGQVLVGTTKTFSFTVTAPATPGTYDFQWQMHCGPDWFGDLTPNQAITVTAPTPVNDADFVSQTVPATMEAGQSYSVTVKMKNTGSTTWTAAGQYQLGSQNPQDNTIWTAGRIDVPGSIATNQTATFTFPVTAPATPGTYDFRWKMVQTGVEWFGSLSPNVVVTVTAPEVPEPPPPASDTPTTTPLPAAPGTFSKTEVITYYDDTSQWVLGQVASVTDVATGLVESATTYDPATALPTKTYAFGKLQSTMTYYADGSLKTVKDGNNHVTTFASWKRGMPQSIQYADGSTQSAVVNDSGWITAVTDETGSRTCYGYDAMGRLASITYPSESAANVCNTSTWAQTTRAFVPVASAEYGLPAGHWRQTESTGNRRKLTYYDALWRPLLVREYDSADVAGTERFVRTAYDAEGRVAFRSYPSTSSNPATGVWTEYDALGRVTSVSQDSELGLLTTTTEYLSGGRIRVTNPRGFQTVSSYMAYDQPTTDWPLVINAPNGVTTTIVRDGFGKPRSLTRSGDDGATATRHYVYYPTQELCKVKEPETGSTVFGYDGAGNLAWSAAGLALTSTTSCQETSGTIAARKVSRSYDARNRLATLVFPDGNGDQAWLYTADGLPETVVTLNEGSEIVNGYTYNRRRLLTGESMVPDSLQPAGWGIGYGYDGLGQVISESAPDNVEVAYTRNALGQATQVTTRLDGGTIRNTVTGASYYPNGAVKQFTYGNGIVHTMTQNARQLPSQSTDCTLAGTCAVANRRLDLGYAYDENGNVAGITDGTTAGRQTRSMGYDGLDRLTGAASPMFGTAAYAYDALDNLTKVHVGGAQGVNATANRLHYYCYNGKNQLDFVRTGAVCAGGSTSPAVVTLGYDVQGNLQYKNTSAYAFDYGNRLRSGGGQSYRYDADGRRVRLDNAGGSRKYSQYSKDGRLLWQRDEVAGKRISNVYFAGSLVAEYSRPLGSNTVTASYFHTDALGSPIAKTDATKAVIETSEYEPYGDLLNRGNDDRAGYTGHVMDSATGLTYMQQRYYDPQIGRFLSVDPVTADSASGSNFNRYWYANNNPYRFTDPDGRIAYQVGNIIYIPVTFRGSGATPELVNAVVQGANNLGSQDGTRIVVVPVDRVMGGVNVMNVSPGNTNPNTQYGEGIVQGPGIIPNSGAHIDSGRTGSDLVGATLHDTLHFAHLADRYTESPASTFGNRGPATPMPGFEDSIMGNTTGTMLMREETQQFQDANNGLGSEEDWNKVLERINSNE